MTYTKQIWNPGEAGGTPVSDTRLDHMETGIDEAHDLYELGVMAAARSFIATLETTTSTSYTDLATVGPTVTVTVRSSGLLLVSLGTTLQNGSAGQTSAMSFALSGANTLAAATERRIMFHSVGADDPAHIGRLMLITGLNAGSTTVTAKYVASGGTAKFQNREITAAPL